MGTEVSGKSLSPAEPPVLKDGDVTVTMTMMMEVQEFHEVIYVKFLSLNYSILFVVK